MSEHSLPRAVDHDLQVAGFLRTLRETGRDTLASVYEHWFGLGVLYIDASGRIVEAGANGSTEEIE